MEQDRMAQLAGIERKSQISEAGKIITVVGHPGKNPIHKTQAMDKRYKDTAVGGGDTDYTGRTQGEEKFRNPYAKYGEEGPVAQKKVVAYHDDEPVDHITVTPSYKAKKESVEETTEELDEAGYDDHIQRLARKGKPPVSKNTGNLDLDLDLDTDSDFDSPVTEPGVFVSADDDDDRDWRDTIKKKSESIEENELKEGCSCGCGSDCNCGPECGCGCNSVNEDQDRMAKLAGLNERGATRPMNFAGTKDHRIKGDTSKSGPEVDTLKHVDKIQKLAWNKAKAKPSHHDSSSKQAKIDIIMPKKRDTVAIKGDSTKASPHTKASKIDIKGDSTKASPHTKASKIDIKGDSSKSKLRGEDLDRLRKLSGIQEKGSAKNPSTDPALDDLSQSFDWPGSGYEDGEEAPKIDIDKVGKSKVTVKGPKGKKGSTLNYDDRVQRLARKKDTGKMTPPKGLNLDAKVQF